jgi:hypothetical protein
MAKYKCIISGYIYDPDVGNSINGIPLGTLFEELDFELLEGIYETDSGSQGTFYPGECQEMHLPGVSGPG